MVANETTVLLCTEISVEQRAYDDVATDGSVSQQEARELIEHELALTAWVATVLNKSRGRQVMCFLANECDARQASELLTRGGCRSVWVSQNVATCQANWDAFHAGTVRCLIVVPDSLHTVWWARRYDDLDTGSEQHGN